MWDLPGPGVEPVSPCIGRQILNHGTTREVLEVAFIGSSLRWYLDIIENVKLDLELPSWSSGQEFACQCRGHGFEPWSGKIPRAVEQQSPCTTTTEPVL